MKRTDRHSGFTLIELMITVAIAAIVMAIAVPAMGVYVQNNRLVTQTNTLVGHLALARSTAVTRNQSVIVCASSTGNKCSKDWSQGWIVFIDANNDKAVTSGEEIIREQAPLQGGNELTSTIGNQVVYDARGFAPSSTGTFSLCDKKLSTANERQIEVSKTGRVRSTGDSKC